MKKSLIFLSLIMIILFFSTINVYASDTNEIVYGNISYLNSTQNSDYVNEYLFNSNHDYKNNFPF